MSAKFRNGSGQDALIGEIERGPEDSGPVLYMSRIETPAQREHREAMQRDRHNAEQRNEEAERVMAFRRQAILAGLPLSVARELFPMPTGAVREVAAEWEVDPR